MAAHNKCKQEGKDWWNVVYAETMDAMMAKFRAHKTAAEAQKVEA